MRSYKLLLKEIKQESEWGEDARSKDEVKLGEVAFDFKGKLDEEVIELKKGHKIYYQYGTSAKLNGEDYVLISTNSIVKDYE
jgi:co-chaperonin GroES (HSP10)